MSSAALRRHRPECTLSKEPYRDFLSLLACLGGSVPGDTLYRASRTAYQWNEQGAVVPDVSCNLPGFLTNISTLEQIVRTVQISGSGVVTLSPQHAGFNNLKSDGSPFWASRQFQMSPSLQEFITRDLQPWKIDSEMLLSYWKKVAVRLLTHTFPVEQIDPQSIRRGQVYTPLLQPFLGEFIISNFARTQECNRLIALCIGASKFGAKGSKELALYTAQQLVHDGTPPHVAGQVQLRQLQLRQLWGEQIIMPSAVPPTNPSLNALQGRFSIIIAQQHIEDGYIGKPWSYLSWKPLHAAQPSRIEQIVEADILYLKGKLYRFSGNFTAAQQCFELIAGQIPSPPSLFRVKLQLAAVYAELGFWQKGHSILGTLQSVSEAQARLIQLSTAELALSECLDATSFDKLESAEALFRGLYNSYLQQDIDSRAKPFRRNLFRACVGLAIIRHLQSRSENRIGLINALGYWRTAKAAARECLIPEKGFPDLICCLASAEILLRLSDATADEELERVAEISDRLDIGRLQQRFTMTSLGTRWADLVNDWLESRGRHRALPRWVECISSGGAEDPWP